MPRKARRIAIGIDLEWPLRHHVGVVSGIMQHAKERGWDCVLAPYPAGAVDGLIGRVTREMAAFVRRARIPAVNVWVDSPDTKLPRVIPDQKATAALAARHLQDRGFRRLGYLGQTRDRNSAVHLAGLRSVLPVETVLLAPRERVGPGPWRSFRKALQAWVRSWKPPVGIFVTNDLLCRYLADACLAEGWRIPDDAGLVGSGNTVLVCEGLSPTLSSVEHGFERVGLRAAQLLERLLRGGRAPSEPTLVAPVGLVPRRSTEVFAVEDRAVAAALRFIADRAAGEIRVGDVASAVPMSRRSLERRFRAALGRTVHDEITRARLERVKRKLVETDLPIKAIARDSGFAGLEHLSRVFRRKEGRSPGSWRRDQRPPR
jgi:LacI family transcriptional regulator